MLAILLFDAGLLAELGISLDLVFSLVDHLNHFFFSPVAFDLFELPLLNLIPEVLNFLIVGLNLVIDFFFPLILLIQLLE